MFNLMLMQYDSDFRSDKSSQPPLGFLCWACFQDFWLWRKWWHFFSEVHRHDVSVCWKRSSGKDIISLQNIWYQWYVYRMIWYSITYINLFCISGNVLILYFIMVFIPGDGMIQEEELEAVVRACLQVHTAIEMPFKYLLN